MRYIAILALLMVFTELPAQWNMPEPGVVFTKTEIPKIHILINVDSLNTLYLEENWYSDHEYPATMVFESSTNLDTLPLVGLRFRGNTSRDKQKKSFKISLNTFVPGREYFGIEKLNVNAEVNDPSLVRSRLCWDLFAEAEVPSSRSNHVELYINGGYYGLYQNIEHIDEEFADSRFASKVGNLYKCTYPADLNYISANPDDYKAAPWGTRTYELKTNEDQDDYSDLAEFIIFLNQASNADLACRLTEYFNVYGYLKVAAMDVLTGNWDGYIYNQNNFYLYHNPLTDQFEYIPYDLDNTWGIDWLDRDWGNRNIYAWSQTGAPRPLYNRLMSIPAFRNIFSWHVQDYLAHIYGTPAHLSAINTLHDFVTASALADPFRPIDFDFTNEKFLSSLDQNIEDSHVDYGIIPFIDARSASASAQLNTVPIAPVIHRVVEDFDAFPTALQLKVYISGPTANTVILNYSLDNGAAQNLAGSFTNGYYQFDILLQANTANLTYQITASGVNGLSRNATCQPREVSFAYGSDALRINEVMSSNQASAIDEAGENEDWIELFQNSGGAINLTEYYLTDNSSAPLKWSLPNVNIPSGTFPLAWADEDLGQGVFHTNFKISAGGEHLFLFQKTSSGLRLIDDIDLPPLPTNYSYGRAADGVLPWILFQEPTPMASNGGVNSTINREAGVQLPYPNPTSNAIYFGGESQFELYSTVGQLLQSGRAESVPLAQYAAGIYIVSVNGRKYRVIKVEGN